MWAYKVILGIARKLTEMVCNNFFKRFEDMNKIYGHLVTVGVTLLIQLVINKWDDNTKKEHLKKQKKEKEDLKKQKKEEDDCKCSNNLNQQMNKKNDLQRYNFWLPKLIDLPHEEAFIKGKEMTLIESKELKNLLKYYIQSPCADYIKLNYKGDGCDVLFNDDAKEVVFVNNVLHTVLGNHSVSNHQHIKETSCVNNLLDYETFASYIMKNSKQSNSKQQIGGASPYHEKLLTHENIFNLCMTCCNNKEKCEQSFPKVSV